MDVRFWGTRGSIPVSGPQYRYGGDTSCVQVGLSDGASLILDAGTGIRALGATLGDASGHILLTHYHWDHIQGMPFFLPAFSAGSAFEIHGPTFEGLGPEEWLARQMGVPYFPNSDAAWRGVSRFHRVTPGEHLRLGSATVKVARASHPQVTLGYRIEDAGTSLVYLCDNEVGIASAQVLDGLLDLVRDVDLLIHDCQYTEEEYATRRGWGHSTPSQVVALAVAARVRRLILFHHDPCHADDAVDALAAQVRGSGNHPFDVDIAREGDCITIPALATRGEHSTV